MPQQIIMSQNTNLSLPDKFVIFLSEIFVQLNEYRLSATQDYKGCYNCLTHEKNEYLYVISTFHAEKWKNDRIVSERIICEIKKKKRKKLEIPDCKWVHRKRDITVQLNKVRTSLLQC